MKIGIISAMDKERALIIPLLNEPTEENIQGLGVVKGKIGNHEVFLSKCGIGKVNAAINTYKLISSLHPDLIINTGVAGGASLNTKVGDVLVADYVAYHDVWCGPGTQPGVADGMDVFMKCDADIVRLSYDAFDRMQKEQPSLKTRMLIGLICSGDKFISDADEIKIIKSLFPEVLAVDMESAAIAQVCCIENIKLNIIRVISDTPGSGCNLLQYRNFWEEAPEKTFSLIEQILKVL